MKVKSTVSRISLFLFFVLLTTAVPQTVFGQAAPATKSNAAQGYSNEQLNSKLMGREMPYRVIVPIEDRSSKARYPVLYLLHGLTGHFSNWTDKTKIVDYAARHKIIIVMPEGADGWYSDSVSVPNDKYESYIIKELIPEVDGKYRTIADRGHRIIAGLSMGGYGSLKFGLKYPETFSLIGSFSGALGAAGWTEKNTGPIAKSLDSVFGPDLDEETDESIPDKFGVYINERPWRDFVAMASEKLIKKEISLDSTFRLRIQGTLGLARDGKTVILKNAKLIAGPNDTAGDPAMLKLAEEAILALADAGWFGYLDMFESKNVTIALEQNDTAFIGRLTADQFDENKARMRASALTLMLTAAGFGSDADTAVLLRAAKPGSDGKTFFVDFHLDKAVFAEMVQRKLAEKRSSDRQASSVKNLEMSGMGRRANDIFKMARELTPDAIKALPYVYMSCGTEDFLIANNRDFLGILNEKKVPHEYREHPGIHDWIFWDDQVREFLDVADRMLKK